MAKKIGSVKCFTGRFLRLEYTQNHFYPLPPRLCYVHAIATRKLKVDLVNCVSDIAPLVLGCSTTLVGPVVETTTFPFEVTTFKFTCEVRFEREQNAALDNHM